MKYITLGFLFSIFVSSSLAAIGTINGSSNVCVGNKVKLSDSTVGGIWTSSGLAIASVDSMTGIVTGISAGSVTITYTLGTDYQTKTLSVRPLPSPIMTTSYSPITTYYICNASGNGLTFIDTTSGGGIWTVDDYSGMRCSSSISTTTILDISSINSSGTLYFTDSFGCSYSLSILIVGPSSAYPKIRGDTLIYVDSTVALKAPLDPYSKKEGTWTSSNISVATITPHTGLVTGVAPGTTTITFLLGCYTSRTLTVLPHVTDSNISKANVELVSVYPNPAKTEITIASSEKITQVAICNLIGQTIYSQENNSKQVQVDIAVLPAGIYFIRVNRMEVRKFIKD